MELDHWVFEENPPRGKERTELGEKELKINKQEEGNRKR